MSDELDPERVFRTRLLASEYLLRAITIKLMLVDPGFARDLRGWFDGLLGQLSTYDRAKPEVLTTLREEYMRLVARAEEFARQAPTVPKPKSIRRRIFEWLERG